MKSYSIPSNCSFLEVLVSHLEEISRYNPLFLLPTKGAKIDFEVLYKEKYGVIPKVFVLNETIEDDLPEHFLFALIFKLLNGELEKTSLKSLVNFPEKIIFLSKQLIAALNELLSHEKKMNISLQSEGLDQIYCDILYKIQKEIEELGLTLAPQKRLERGKRLENFLKKIPPHRPIVAAGIVALKPFTFNILDSLKHRDYFHIFICADPDESDPLPQGHPFYLGRKLLNNLATNPLHITGDEGPGIAILECQTLEEEAMQIAQKLYALNAQEKKTAFVTHNHILKTLVKQELLKFNILPACKETLRFSHTPEGRFILLTAALLFGEFSLETLFSFLKNPLSQNNFEEVCAMEVNLRKKSLPLSALLKTPEFKAFEAIMSQRIEDQKPRPSLFYIEYLKNFLGEGIEYSPPMKAFETLPPLSPTSFLNIFEEILNNTQATPQEDLKASHYIHFWSPLEARLRTMDVMILGDLTENSWPQNSSNPFLPESLKQNLNLPSSLIYQGLSFLDFLMLSKSAKTCMITYSLLKNGAAQTPSRFLYHDLKSLRLSPKTPKTVFLPLKIQESPTARLDQKPLHLHQSDVRLLIQNPYLFYLRKILKITPEQPFQKGIPPRLLGTLIHRAFEYTLKNKPFHLEEFAALSNYQKSQFQSLLESFTHKMDALKSLGFEFFPEYQKTVSFGKVSVSARMDLVLKKGSAHRIIDYKTSLPPSTKSVLEWREPQLALEALCFDNVTSLEYWHTSLAAKEIKESTLAPKEEWIHQTQDFFGELFENYLRDDFVFEKTENFFEKDDQHLMKIHL